MNKLPDELIIEQLEYMTPSEVYSLYKTSRRYKKIIQEKMEKDLSLLESEISLKAWKTLFLTGSDADMDVEKIPKNYNENFDSSYFLDLFCRNPKKYHRFMKYKEGYVPKGIIMYIEFVTILNGIENKAACIPLYLAYFGVKYNNTTKGSVYAQWINGGLRHEAISFLIENITGTSEIENVIKYCHIKGHPRFPLYNVDIESAKNHIKNGIDKFVNDYL